MITSFITREIEGSARAFHAGRARDDLKAMAELGRSSFRLGEIASAPALRIDQVAPLRPDVISSPHRRAGAGAGNAVFDEKSFVGADRNGVANEPPAPSR